MAGSGRVGRRAVLRVTLALAGLGVSRAATAAEPLRLGITPVFLDDRAAFIARWRDYLSERLRRPVRFVQRQTYREVTDLVLGGEIDAAWICGYPYVRHARQLRLLAVPLYHGEPLYRSYVIVNAADTATADMDGLRRRVFAYSDPDSNSGFLVPRVLLFRAGLDPDRFFARTFFTWSHRDVVVAVAESLADGGAVDGYVWETLKMHNADLTSRTRVVRQSETFGFPPVVARQNMAQPDFDTLQAVLIGMRDDAAGRTLLSDLNLDGFTPGSADLYDGIRAAVAEIGWT